MNPNEEYKCFAEDTSGRKTKCAVLRVSECIGHDFCAHYKSESRCCRESLDVTKRLRTLPKEKQSHIKNKYGLIF